MSEENKIEETSDTGIGEDAESLKAEEVLEGEKYDEDEEESDIKIDVVGFGPQPAAEKPDDADERKYENTYQLNPMFQVNRKAIKNKTQDLLQTTLEGKAYSYPEMLELSKSLSKSIRDEIQSLKYERYKIVSYVMIGEKVGEGVTIVNQNLWDTERDHIVHATFQNASLFANVVVALMYKC